MMRCVVSRTKKKKRFSVVFDRYGGNKKEEMWVGRLKEAFRGEEAEDMGIGWFSQESTVGPTLIRYEN